MNFNKITWKYCLALFIITQFSCDKDVTSILYRDFQGTFVYSDYKNSSNDIYILNSEGNKQITNASTNQISPQWLPDGKHIIYLSDDADGLHFHILNVFELIDKKIIGTGVLDVGTFFYPEITASPDGNFVVLQSTDSIVLFSINHDFSLNRLSSKSCATELTYLTWAPDSKKFSCACPGLDSLRHLFVFDILSNQFYDFTKFSDLHIRDQSWSFNSSLIAFISYFDIYTINSDGSGLKKIIDTENFLEASLRFSPFDNRLVYERADSLFDLVIYDPITQSSEILLNDYGYIFGKLEWIDQGKYILYGYGDKTFDKDEIRLYELETRQNHTVWDELVKGIHWIND